MRNVWLAAVLVMTACGGKKGKDKFDEALVEMDAIATKLCACTDAECLGKVQTELLTFRKGLKDRFGKDKATGEQEKRGKAIEDRLRECRTRGTGAGFEEALAKLGELRTQACACADRACADQVKDGWKAYRATMKERLGSAANPSNEQDARGKVLDTEMKACLDKFEPKAPPPPAEKPAR